MSHPLPHTSAHENDSKLETKHQQRRINENCDQKQRARSLPRPISQIQIQNSKMSKPPFFKAIQRLSKENFSSQLPGYPTESEYIRPNPSNFFDLLRPGDVPAVVEIEVVLKFI